MGSGKLLKKAKQKYGIENFEKTILFECSSKEEMDNKEAEIVNEDFISRDDVYNIKLGGDGGWDYINSTGKNMSGDWKSVGKNSQLIKQKTGKWPGSDWLKELKATNPLKYEEHCKHISDKIKQSIKENGAVWTGRHHSKETIQKMKSQHAKNHHQSGEKNSQYGKIAIYNETTFEHAMISKNDPIPEGWAKGRFYNTSVEELKKRKQLVDQIKAIYPNSKVSIRMNLTKLENAFEIASNPNKPNSLLNSVNKNAFSMDRYKKYLQKQKDFEKKIALLEEQYEFYSKYGWKEMKAKYCYQHSRENFIQQCKKYVKSYKSQNGKKRGI